MRIAFVFNTEFDITSVFMRPLGGSESAVTYLAIELAKLGVHVTLFSHNPKIEQAFGVNCYSITQNNSQIQINEDIIKTEYDYIVIKNGIPEFAFNLKSMLQYQPKIIFWTGHAADQPAIKNLANKDVVDALDKIVCVSKWHREQMISRFSLPEEKVTILRNAIGFAFQDLFTSKEEFIAAKQHDTKLCYTSTPFRGLGILVNVFPKLHNAQQDVELDVFSSMQVYGIPKEKDNQFSHFYQQAEHTPGIKYHGSLPQAKLAAAMRQENILAYPNTFAETSCIAVMEAMAAGLHIVTTAHGALPETTLGRGTLVDIAEVATSTDDSFIGKLSEVCILQKDDPTILDKCYEQVEIMNKEHTWRVRARQWQKMLKSEI